MTLPRWTRREVTIGGAMAFLMASRPARADSMEESVSAALDAIFPKPDSAAQLGQRFVDGAVSSSQWNDRIARLEGALRLQAWHASGGGAPSLQQRLNDRIADDYAADRLTKLDGCHLTHIERDLCVVAYLRTVRV